MTVHAANRGIPGLRGRHCRGQRLLAEGQGAPQAVCVASLRFDDAAHQAGGMELFTISIPPKEPLRQFGPCAGVLGVRGEHALPSFARQEK